MLVEFSVENFRSIRDKQTLSLLSSRSKKNNSYIVQLKNGKTISLLPSAAIYGANAAGKTNIIKAIATMKSIVVTPRGLFQLPYNPFIFSKTTKDAPTKFNIIIIIDGLQYEYGFVIDKNKVYAEWLYKGRQTMFTRQLTYTADSSEYLYKSPSGNLTGQKETWKKSTRPDALFLSTAVGLNSEQLKPIYDWFSSTLEIDVKLKNDNIDKATTWCNSESGKRDILNFLQEADFYITDIYANKHNDVTKIPPEVTQQMIRMGVSLEQINIYDIKFKHPTDYNDGEFIDIANESEGTQKMYYLAGYWLDVLQKNKVIFFDELNNSLHPVLVKFLINKFNVANSKSTAQLIFTTHDTSILDKQVLDRDQIWFCERDNQQATTIKSLLEYRARSDVNNYEKAYLSGRYGAIPIVHED